MSQGVIKKIVSDKGFGFITPDGGGADVFFHVSSLEDRSGFDLLQEGTNVRFDAERGEKGPRATSVALL